MAIKLRANPAPLTGALFVSNPRKRKKPVKRRRNVAKKRRVVRKRKNTKTKSAASKRRSNALKRSRKNALALRANRRRKSAVRRNGTRKGQKRTTARRAYMKKRRNGTRKGQKRTTARRAYKKRKNPMRTRILRQNPLQPKFLKGLDDMIGKLPIIGKPLKPVISPSLVGMAGGALLTVGQQYASKIPVIGEYLVGKYGFALYGLGLGAICQYLPFKKDTKDMLSVMFAVAGGSINAYQLAQEHILPMISGGSANGNGAGATSGYNMGSIAYDPMSGLAFDDMAGHAPMGDGGQWEVGNFYRDAELNDAQYAGHDFSASEGHSALMGQGYWCQAFPMPATRAYGQKSLASRHAGLEGHRWGWLIKTLGFDRFQKLAKMKPKDRVALIHKLKSVAQASAKKSFDAMVEANSTPVVTKVSTSGIGLDMEGLVLDPMAGLAYVGAGI
jgi:hypothetical protein